MNRHQQEAKKYLSQAFGLNQRIESKLGQIEDLHDLATKATVTYSDMPKSRTGMVPRWKMPLSRS